MSLPVPQCSLYCRRLKECPPRTQPGHQELAAKCHPSKTPNSALFKQQITTGMSCLPTSLTFPGMSFISLPIWLCIACDGEIKRGGGGGRGGVFEC